MTSIFVYVSYNFVKPGTSNHRGTIAPWLKIVLRNDDDQNDVAAMATYTFFWFYTFSTLRPRQNGRHFPDDIFKCIFLKQNIWISIKISLKFVPRGF